MTTDTAVEFRSMLNEIWQHWFRKAFLEDAKFSQDENLVKMLKEDTKAILTLLAEDIERGEVSEKTRKFLRDIVDRIPPEILESLRVELVMFKFEKLQETITEIFEAEKVGDLKNVFKLISEMERIFVEKLLERLKEKIEGHSKVLEALVEIAKVRGSLKELSKKILEKIVEVSECEIGFYGTVEGEKIRAFVHSENVFEGCKVGEEMSFKVRRGSIWEKVIREKREIVVNKFEKELPERHIKIKNILVIPVVSGGKVVSVLGVANKKGKFEEGDVEILKGFASSLYTIAEKEMLRNIYETLIETVSVGILIIEKDGTISFANKEVEKEFKEGRDNIVGRKFYEFVHEDDVKLALKYFELRRRGEKAPQRYEIRVKTPKGIKYVLVSIKPLSDGSFLASVMDITEKKKKEKELEIALNTLRALHEVDRMVIEGKPLKEIARATLKKLTEIVGSEVNLAAIFKYDESNRFFYPLHSYYGELGLKPDELREKEDLIKGKAVIVDDILSLRDLTEFERRLIKVRAKSYVMFPLMVRGKIRGLLVLASKNDAAFKDYAKVLKEFSDQIAIAIHEAELFDMRMRSIEQIEENIVVLATLVDKIKNPLTAILLMTEELEGEVKEKIEEQVNRIIEIVRKVDEGWAKSEEVRKFLRVSWGGN